MSPAWMLEHAWLIPALPFASFWLILFVGKRLPFKGAEIGIASVGLAFVLAILTGAGWIARVDDSSSAAGPAAIESVNCSAGAHGEEADHASEGGEEADPAGHGADVADEAEAEGSHGEATENGHEGEADEAALEGEEGHHATEAVTCQWTWFENEGTTFTVGTMVDGLTAMMLLVVTLVSGLVHVYSTDYVGGDRRYTHFFAFLSLFTASMLMYVMAENTLQMIVGWELVGVCSFALIGHWWEEKPNSDAALKAFITNRVGDVGLLCGMTLLYFGAGKTFDSRIINEMANNGEMSHTLLIVASCALMAAVMSKSGQFILHTWLPDAMAGPTPVSALIHAATMVVAGIFMIARLYGVFWNGLSIGTSTINLMALVGAVTCTFGAALAFVQKDIKKVLAYSTVSQLGYMVMGLGVGAWTGAIFHLFTHAFFKACLFLGAGSLSHACHHSFNMVDDYGGLRKKMPITHATFLVGTAALVAIPPLSGFFSKDEILAGAYANGGAGGYKLMLAMGTLTAGMTAAYMTRTYWYSFMGEYRGGHGHDEHGAHDVHAANDHDAHAAHDAHGAYDAHGVHGAADDHGHAGEPVENGLRITVPLVILAFLAIVAGFANVPAGMFPGDALPLHKFEHYVQPTAAYFPDIEIAPFNWTIAIVSTAVGLAGVALAYGYFWRGLGPQRLTERNGAARAGKRVLENKYYLDWLYTDVIVGAIKGPIARAAYWFNMKVLDGIVNGAAIGASKAGELLYTYFDQKVVDGAVNGAGALAEGSGGILRRTQTGKVQQYGALFFAAAALLAGLFVLIV